MKLTKQLAVILAIVVLILMGIGIYFLENLTAQIIVGVVGLFFMWYLLRLGYQQPEAIKIDTSNYQQLATDLIKFVGGKENIVNVDRCQTRVLLEVNDSSLAQVENIRELGIAGVLRPSNTKVQLIVKQWVEPIYQAIKKEMNNE